MVCCFFAQEEKYKDLAVLVQPAEIHFNEQEEGEARRPSLCRPTC